MNLAVTEALKNSEFKHTRAIPTVIINQNWDAHSFSTTALASAELCPLSRGQWLPVPLSP